MIKFASLYDGRSFCLYKCARFLLEFHYGSNFLPAKSQDHYFYCSRLSVGSMLVEGGYWWPSCYSTAWTVDHTGSSQNMQQEFYLFGLLLALPQKLSRVTFASSSWREFKPSLQALFTIGISTLTGLSQLNQQLEVFMKPSTPSEPRIALVFSHSAISKPRNGWGYLPWLWE